eukprot:411330-Pyramimonas_sp.AAC.1
MTSWWRRIGSDHHEAPLMIGSSAAAWAAPPRPQGGPRLRLSRRALAKSRPRICARAGSTSTRQARGSRSGA